MKKNIAVFAFLGPIPGTLKEMALEDAVNLGKECTGRGLFLMEEAAVGGTPFVGHGFYPDLLVLPATRARFPDDQAFYKALLVNAAELHAFLWGASHDQARLSGELREISHRLRVSYHLNCYIRRFNQNFVTRL